MSASRVCSPRYTGTTIEIVCSPTTSMDCRTAERITRRSCAAEGVILTSQGDDLAVWAYSSDRPTSPFLRSPQLDDWTIHGSRSSSTEFLFTSPGDLLFAELLVLRRLQAMLNGSAIRLPGDGWSLSGFRSRSRPACNAEVVAESGNSRPSGWARSPSASCSLVSREVRPRCLATASGAATPVPQTRCRYLAELARTSGYRASAAWVTPRSKSVSSCRRLLANPSLSTGDGLYLGTSAGERVRAACRLSRRVFRVSLSSERPARWGS